MAITRCLSEASRTYNNIGTYGVSLNISPYRNVDTRRWGDYSQDEQCEILRDIWCNAQADIVGKVDDRYIYEATKRSNMHLHAIIDCNEQEMELIQKCIHEKYGYKKDPIDRVLHFSKTLKHERFWLAYMSKEQRKNDPDYIPYRPFPELINQ